MVWKKQGLFFNVTSNSDWMHSHAAVPFVDKNPDGNNYLYFTTRSVSNISYVTRLEFNDDLEIISEPSEIVVGPGGLGSFEEHGVTASYLIDFYGKKLLYYVGWNRGVTVPFRNAIGVAISDDGGKSFQKYSNGPIVDRSPVDPYFVAGTCVKPFDKNKLQMWYISCVNWKMVNDKPRHFYHLKHATSSDGFNWERIGQIAIDFKDEFEYAISQPWVVIEDEVYKMWFSHRAQKEIDTYRIGYAESKDGVSWNRHLNSGIDVSDSGWDSEMVCYPYVFELKGNKYMFYNGNAYGGSGIGLAKWET